jgi:hypothetical protein
MVRAPRKRPRDARRLLWLVPVAVLAALHARGDVGVPEVLAFMSIGGLLLLLQDPRLAIACGVVWLVLVTNHVVQSVPSGVRLVDVPTAAAGLMLIIAAGRLWIMRDNPAA